MTHASRAQNFPKLSFLSVSAMNISLLESLRTQQMNKSLWFNSNNSNNFNKDL